MRVFCVMISMLAVFMAAPTMAEIRVAQTQLSMPRCCGCWAGWNNSVALYSAPSVDILTSGQMHFPNVTLGLRVAFSNDPCVGGAGSNGVAVFTGRGNGHERRIQFIDLVTGIPEGYNDTLRLPEPPAGAVGSKSLPLVVVAGLTSAIR